MRAYLLNERSHCEELNQASRDLCIDRCPHLARTRLRRLDNTCKCICCCYLTRRCCAVMRWAIEPPSPANTTLTMNTFGSSLICRLRLLLLFSRTFCISNWTMSHYHSLKMSNILLFSFN